MYKIKLPHFEGPLDLLLFFIRRDELDIYDIPISKITNDFIEYLHYIKQFDLEVAGDFILMASTLMQIKVRMLLPKEVDEEGEEIDPRMDLVNALLEYKRYKEVTDDLTLMESNQKKLGFRGYYDEDKKDNPQDMEVLMKNITIYDLMKAFKSALAKRPQEATHQIKKMPVTIEQQIHFITEKVTAEGEVNFVALINGMREKIRIVITFVALLELVKMGNIGLRESENFNEFVLYGLK